MTRKKRRKTKKRKKYEARLPRVRLVPKRLTHPARRIIRYFIQPLLQILWDSEHFAAESREQLVRFLFDADNRPIDIFVAVKNFDMPGVYLAQPYVPIPGYGDRKVERYQRMLIRCDRNVNEIDVQLFHKDMEGQPEYQIFRLTVDEFHDLIKYNKVRMKSEFDYKYTRKRLYAKQERRKRREEKARERKRNKR